MRNFFRPTIVVLSVCMGACATVDTGIYLEWAGIYTTTGAERRADPITPTGSREVNAEGVQLVASTSRIPARLGTKFGISYGFDGLQGNRVPHRVVWRFPAGGMVNPRTGQAVTTYENRASCYRGESCMAAWHFTHSWEMVPGPWVVEIWTGERRLVAQTFEVVAE